MSHKPSKRVDDAVRTMYAQMARASGKQAVAMAGSCLYSFQEVQAKAINAETWANKAGGNALRWGLV